MSESRTEQRLVFGAAAQLYDLARPSYPAQMIEDILSYAAPVARILDVGAGTGKATYLFAEKGLSVVAVDPSQEMADVGKLRCSAYPAVSFVVANFEDFPLGSERFDLVVAAQVWHWLKPEIRWTKAHRALRQGGGLALFWNRPRQANATLRAQLDVAYERLAPRLANREPGSGLNESAQLPQLRDSGLFVATEERSYEWRQPYSTEEYLRLLESQSDHRMLPAATLRSLLDAVGEILDKNSAGLTIDYRTLLCLGRRLD